MCPGSLLGEAASPLRVIQAETLDEWLERLYEEDSPRVGGASLPARHNAIAWISWDSPSLGRITIDPATVSKGQAEASAPRATTRAGAGRR